MLNKLFASELRMKIMSFFFTSLEKGFFESEIKDFLKQKGQIWRKELEFLKELGFLKVEELDSEVEIKEDLNKSKDLSKNTSKTSKQGKNNLKTKNVQKIEKFYLNKDFFLFPELKSLFSKARFFSNREIFDRMIKDCSPKLLILTGKFINKPESLIDILIVGNFSKRHFLSSLKELENVLNEEINYTVFSEEEYNYRRSVADIFLYNILGDEKIVLAGDIEGVKDDGHKEKFLNTLESDNLVSGV